MDRELLADVSICRATRSRLSAFSHCVCLALCVRRAGGEMDSTRLPAPTSHPTSLPNRPALPDCTNPAPTAQLLLKRFRADKAIFLLCLPVREVRQCVCQSQPSAWKAQAGSGPSRLSLLHSSLCILQKVLLKKP